MNYKVRFLMAVVLVALALPCGAIGEATHAPLDPTTGRPIPDPSGPQNRLYKAISACLSDRPDGGGLPGSASGDGKALYEARCFACHSKKDPQRSIACINGPCAGLKNGKAFSFAQMPPDAPVGPGPLDPADKAAIIQYLSQTAN